MDTKLNRYMECQEIVTTVESGRWQQSVVVQNMSIEDIQIACQELKLLKTIIKPFHA